MVWREELVRIAGLDQPDGAGREAGGRGGLGRTVRKTEGTLSSAGGSSSTKRTHDNNRRDHESGNHDQPQLNGDEHPALFTGQSGDLFMREPLAQGDQVNRECFHGGIRAERGITSSWPGVQAKMSSLGPHGSPLP